MWAEIFSETVATSISGGVGVCAYACVCVYTCLGGLLGTFSSINTDLVGTNSPSEDHRPVLMWQHLITTVLVCVCVRVNV